MKQFFCLFFTCAMLVCSNANAQLFLLEDFNYTDSLTGKGWTGFSGGTTNTIKTTGSGLSHTGYPSSGIGNATFMTTSGQDVLMDISNTTTSGSLYASFMLNDSSAQAAGDYFFAFLPRQQHFQFFRAYLYQKRLSRVLSYWRV